MRSFLALKLPPSAEAREPKFKVSLIYIASSQPVKQQQQNQNFITLFGLSIPVTASILKKQDLFLIMCAGVPKCGDVSQRVQASLEARRQH